MKSVSIEPVPLSAALTLPCVHSNYVPCRILAQHGYHFSGRARGRAPALPFAVTGVDRPTLAVTADVPPGLVSASQWANLVLPHCSLLGLGTMVRICAAGRWHSSERRLGATASSAQRANILSAVARTTILTFVRALCLDTVK